MLFATIESLRMLHFDAMAALITEFMVFAGHVALGLVIFGIGLFLGNLAARTIEASSLGPGSSAGAGCAIGDPGARRRHGPPSDGSRQRDHHPCLRALLGAIAVALALAFGLGCREMAAEAMKGWVSQIGDRRLEDQRTRYTVTGIEDRGSSDEGGSPGCPPSLKGVAHVQGVQRVRHEGQRPRHGHRHRHRRRLRHHRQEPGERCHHAAHRTAARWRRFQQSVLQC